MLGNLKKRKKKFAPKELSLEENIVSAENHITVWLSSDRERLNYSGTKRDTWPMGVMGRRERVRKE